jgi:hypothetical protein
MRSANGRVYNPRPVPNRVETRELPPDPPDIDLTTYRLDQHEKRMDAQDVKLDAIQTTLNRIEVNIAGLSTKDTVRNWGFGIVVAVITSVVAVGGLLFAASGNQLSAFQAGLSAVQTGVAVHQPLVPDK